MQQVRGTPGVLNRRRHIDIEKTQNMILVWLDSYIDNNNEECQNEIAELQCVVNDINTFTDNDECFEFILNINNNKVCMIISGSLGRLVMPCIHDIPQLDSILVFCANKKHHEQWANEWFKIKGVYSDIISICEALKQVSRQCEQNAVPISLAASGKKLNQLDPSFMYTQLLKETLLDITFKKQHI
ncbi:hypothetical protein I4U23_025720 [Adineta vaga]|nr:hypothetical protein I4U23_025720 [Adineta vaga]